MKTSLTCVLCAVAFVGVVLCGCRTPDSIWEVYDTNKCAIVIVSRADWAGGLNTIGKIWNHNMFRDDWLLFQTVPLYQLVIIKHPEREYTIEYSISYRDRYSIERTKYIEDIAVFPGVTISTNRVEQSTQWLDSAELKFKYYKSRFQFAPGKCYVWRKRTHLFDVVDADVTLRELKLEKKMKDKGTSGQ